MTAALLFLDGEKIDPAILATFGPVFDDAKPGVRPHNIVNGDTKYARPAGALWQRLGSDVGPRTGGRLAMVGRIRKRRLPELHEVYTYGIDTLQTIGRDVPWSKRHEHGR